MKPANGTVVWQGGQDICPYELYEDSIPLMKIGDDDQWTEEDEQAVAEAEEDIRAGRVYTLEEVEKELGL
ncbi:hypothetical protein [Paradesulfitobacterium ferrireducens]|uniref:hypothetical protein n=1 Tax=Paradesulfitobacterium ferrireducens TaxID=2816476 RepID=UPI002E2BDF60|nr:hypothetical protein [Paradesulfitobacterium ferrireducens]